MKRTLLPLLIAALAMLILAACGGSGAQAAPSAQTSSAASSAAPAGALRREDAPKGSSSQASAPASQPATSAPLGEAQGIGDTMPVSLEAVLMYLETRDTSFFDPHALTPSEQAQLRADVESQGGTISFAPDGSFTIRSPEGGVITVSPDGTFSGTDDDGQSFDGGDLSSWPSGPLASAVPQPDFAISMAHEEAGSLDVLFDGVTLEQAKAYAAKLKPLFPINAEENDYTQHGMYGFSGENAAGLRVDLNYLDQGGGPSCALSVMDPAEWEPENDDYVPESYGMQTSYAGEAMRYNDTWPTSGLLAMLPAPTFGDDLQVRYDEQDKMTAAVYGATPADFDAYLKLVKDRGFTVDPEYEEDPQNYNSKMYMAQNSAGNAALVQYMEAFSAEGTVGILSIIVTLPE